MGIEKDNEREYIQNVAREFMGHLKIRTASYKGYMDMTTLARMLYNTYMVDILRIFREKKFKGDALGRIAWYGLGQAPQGHFSGWGIGEDISSRGTHVTISQVLGSHIANFHNGAYQMMQLAAATIVAEIVTLMYPKLMIASVIGKDPEEVVPLE